MLGLNNKNDKLLNPIIEAFTKIESKDCRVEKVVLTRKKYHELISLDVDLSHITGHNRASVGNLWGAEITIGDECKVSTNDQFHIWDEKINFTSHFFCGLNIFVKSRAQPLYRIGSNEWTAINTLRDMISESDFRKFAKHGFILVNGKSGNIYQVFRKSPHTRVWKNGKVIEEVCVRIKNHNIPPTDNLIAFKTMIETDEEEFRKSGNVYNMKTAA